MDSALVLPAIVFVGVVAVVYAISTLVTGRGETLRRRLDDHAVAVTVMEAKRLERIEVLKNQKYSSIPALDTLLHKLKPAETAAVELAHAAVRLTVPQYLLGRLLFAVGAYLAVRIAMDAPILAIVAGLVGIMVPRIFIIIKGRRRKKAFEGLLAEAIDMLVGALRAGYGFLQGIESVTKEIEEPIRGELIRVLDDVNVGIDPIDALQAVSTRVDSYDYDLFVSAVAVQRKAGGNLAEVMENIANTIRERRRIRAEVRSLTTGPRVSSYVLGLIPIGLLIGLSLISQDYRDVMLGSRIGHLMIGFSTFWSLLGLVLSQSVAKVEY